MFFDKWFLLSYNHINLIPLEWHVFVYQVQFLALNNVATVSTQGHPDPLEYITSYRLEYSIDCSVFVSYVDANGLAMVYLHLY